MRPDYRPLINTGGATTFGALNMTPDLSPTFPSRILHFPLVAPPDLILVPSIHYSDPQPFPFMNQGIKSPKSREWSLPIDFYWSSIR
jgi:hypothetical protein